jgi:hypothetical protein
MTALKKVIKADLGCPLQEERGTKVDIGPEFG